MAHSPPSPNRPPRVSPNKKTDVEIKEVLLNTLHMGLTITTACKIAGISRETMYRWCKEDPIFGAKAEAEHAQGVGEVTDALMKQCLLGNVKAIQFFLVNRSEEFKNKPQITEQELQVLEKVIALMVDKQLLPKETDSLAITVQQMN